MLDFYQSFNALVSIAPDSDCPEGELLFNLSFQDETNGKEILSISINLETIRQALMGKPANVNVFFDLDNLPKVRRVREVKDIFIEVPEHEINLYNHTLYFSCEHEIRKYEVDGWKATDRLQIGDPKRFHMLPTTLGYMVTFERFVEHEQRSLSGI